MSSHKSMYGNGIKPVEVDPRTLIEAIFIDTDDDLQLGAKNLAHVLTVLESILREKDDRIDSILTKYGPDFAEKMTKEEQSYSSKLFILKRDVNQCVGNFCNDLISYKIKELNMKELLDHSICMLLELVDRADDLKIRL